MNFHEERLLGVGASDIGAIMGLVGYATPMDIWMVKTGRMKPDEQKSNASMRFGSFAESFVASEYSLVTGRKLVEHTELLRHPSAPLVGHVDRLVADAPIGVEIKTVGTFAFGPRNGWGEDGTDKIPSSYLMQVTAYMSMMEGYDEWDVAALVGGIDLHIYTVRRDTARENSMLDYVKWWWNSYVVKDVPPDGFQLDTAPRCKADTLEVTPGVASLITELAGLDAAIKDRKIKYAAIKNTILESIGDASLLTFEDELLATVKHTKRGVNIRIES